MNTMRQQLAGTGIQTSALAVGGNKPGTGITSEVESWNGTSWTEVGNINTQRYILAASGTDNTGVLAFGGDTPPVTAVTEEWNGASWTEISDLNTARNNLGGTGTTNSSLAFGGATPTITTSTEEWSSSSNVIQTITTS